MNIQNTYIGLLLVIAIGFMVSKISTVGFLWGAFIFGLGMYLTVKNKNRNGEAHLFAAYIMGAEVFFRMTWAGLPWDFAKYGIIFLLAVGLIFDNKKRQIPYLIILYILLMLPAIYLTFDYFEDLRMVKTSIFFNLLGHLVLMISTLYFYQMKFTMKDFINLSRAIVYGVLTMSILVLTNVGDYSSIQFTFGSNASASGGFSGNQVATAFGLGVLIISINLILKNRLFTYLVIDIGLVILFIFQGFMTFSRGGMMGAGLALLAAAFIYYFSNINKFILFFKKNIFLLLIGILLGVITFNEVDKITGGNLSVRYFNVDAEGFQKKEDYSTGRGEISKGDIKLFYESDFYGVGVGVSSKERERSDAAHVEYSRLLAEHGILGLASMIIMFYLPLKQFLKLLSRPENQIILVSFILISLLTMTHAATRLGMTGFFYGMAFIILTKKIQDNGKKI